MKVSSSNYEQPLSLAEQAYNELVKRITKLELEPGEILAEKNLIEELKIGRTPIREALQRLAIEGLVTHLHNRGMFVSEITFSDVQEIYDFRSLIDGYACRMAATRGNKHHASELMVCHKNLVNAMKKDDIDAYIEHDRKFHRLLAEASNNTFLAETMPRIFNLHLRLWFYIVTNLVYNWHSVAKEHQVMTRDVSEAVEQGDSERAELAMKNYIARRQQELRQELYATAR